MRRPNPKTRRRGRNGEPGQACSAGTSEVPFPHDGGHFLGRLNVRVVTAAFDRKCLRVVLSQLFDTNHAIVGPAKKPQRHRGCGNHIDHRRSDDARGRIVKGKPVTAIFFNDTGRNHLVGELDLPEQAGNPNEALSRCLPGIEPPHRRLGEYPAPRQIVCRPVEFDAERGHAAYGYAAKSARQHKRDCAAHGMAGDVHSCVRLQQVHDIRRMMRQGVVRPMGRTAVPARDRGR